MKTKKYIILIFGLCNEQEKIIDYNIQNQIKECNETFLKIEEDKDLLEHKQLDLKDNLIDLIDNNEPVEDNHIQLQKENNEEHKDKEEQNKPDIDVNNSETNETSVLIQENNQKQPTEQLDQQPQIETENKDENTYKQQPKSNIFKIVCFVLLLLFFVIIMIFRKNNSQDLNTSNNLEEVFKLKIKKWGKILEFCFQKSNNEIELFFLDDYIDSSEIDFSEITFTKEEFDEFSYKEKNNILLYIPASTSPIPASTSPIYVVVFDNNKPFFSLVRYNELSFGDILYEKQQEKRKNFLNARLADNSKTFILNQENKIDFLKSLFLTEEEIQQELKNKQEEIATLFLKEKEKSQDKTKFFLSSQNLMKIFPEDKRFEFEIKL